MSQPVTIDQALHVALKHHRAGQLGQAELIYRQILARQPNHPDALQLLGTIACQVGKHDVGLEMINRALAIAPRSAASYNALGDALRSMGRRDEALAAYRRTIELDPNYIDARAAVAEDLTAREQWKEAMANLLILAKL